LEKHCGSFVNDGICDLVFNTRGYAYDGGDCCAATCTKSNCGIGALMNAFGSANISSGDGFPNCLDPNMVPITIRLNNFSSSRDPAVMELSDDRLNFIEDYWPDFWTVKPTDTLLSLSCDGKNVLKSYVDESMTNKTETVMVKDDAYCTLTIENKTASRPYWKDVPIWYFDYAVFHGDKESMNIRPTMILESHNAVKDSSSIDILSNCFFEKLSEYVDNTTMYVGKSPSIEAIHWLEKDNSGNSNCEFHAFLERYALTVLNFAAPINGSDGGNRMWIRPDVVCSWPSVNCIGNYKQTRLDFLNLDLSSTEISGTIATEIGLLENLVTYEVGMFRQELKVYM